MHTFDRNSILLFFKCVHFYHSMWDDERWRDSLQQPFRIVMGVPEIRVFRVPEVRVFGNTKCANWTRFFLHFYLPNFLPYLMIFQSEPPHQMYCSGTLKNHQIWQISRGNYGEKKSCSTWDLRSTHFSGITRKPDFRVIIPDPSLAAAIQNFKKIYFIMATARKRAKKNLVTRVRRLVAVWSNNNKYENTFICSLHHGNTLLQYYSTS